jgi:WD40 repeat protein
LLLGANNFQILKSFKAHDSPITKVKYAPDLSMLTTTSEEGSIFFFALQYDDIQFYDPLCMVQLTSKINDFRWDGMSKNILCAT